MTRSAPRRSSVEVLASHERGRVMTGSGLGLTRRGLLGAAAVGAGALVRVPAAFAAGPHPAGGGASVVGHRIWVNVRASEPARVKARLWPTAHPSQVVETPWYATNRSDAARIPVLAASIVGTDWSWQGVVQDRLGLVPPIAGRVRTLSGWPHRGTPSAFTFAFGSCITHLYPAPVLPHAAAADPKFFAIIGDMDYVDVGPAQNYALWSKWFRAWMRNQYVKPLVRKTPIMGVQDDHDYGLDGCWADTWKVYTAEAYADVIPGAQYPATSYRRWGLGDVDCWLLDCRRYKDPKHGPYENGLWMSTIRSVQRRWLLDGLAASPARIKIIFSPMSFAYYWSKGEQALVTQWIQDHVSGTVVFCTGDRHQTSFVHPAPRIWELLACPINNPKKTLAYPVPGLVWVEHPDGIATSNAVGLVEVDTATARPSLTLRAVTDNGATLHAETIRV